MCNWMKKWPGRGRSGASTDGKIKKEIYEGSGEGA